MNLVIDIGNTAVKASFADGITLGRTYRYQGEKFMDFIISLAEENRPEVMIVSSSREMSKVNEQLLSSKCDKLIIVNSDILSEKGLPNHIAPDRGASIIAARYIFSCNPCIIFDFGTTLTIDYIGLSGKYEGGAVSLGCRTRFKALNRYSRNMPLVQMPEGETLENGTSLISSIESGIISGIMFEIDGYMSKNPDKTAIFTGTDANYFAKRTKNSIFVICNLVLIGLALMADERL